MRKPNEVPADFLDKESKVCDFLLAIHVPKEMRCLVKRALAYYKFLDIRDSGCGLWNLLRRSAEDILYIPGWNKHNVGILQIILQKHMRGLKLGMSQEELKIFFSREIHLQEKFL